MPPSCALTRERLQQRCCLFVSPHCMKYFKLNEFLWWWWWWWWWRCCCSSFSLFCKMLCMRIFACDSEMQCRGFSQVHAKVIYFMSSLKQLINLCRKAALCHQIEMLLWVYHHLSQQNCTCSCSAGCWRCCSTLCKTGAIPTVTAAKSSWINALRKDSFVEPLRSVPINHHYVNVWRKTTHGSTVCNPKWCIAEYVDYPTWLGHWGGIKAANGVIKWLSIFTCDGKVNYRH